MALRLEAEVADVKESLCSNGLPVDFFWIDCRDGRHIDAAVRILMGIIFDPPARCRDHYREADLRNSFRIRLQRAAQGRLIPSDHVKEIIQAGSSVDMFEIRWKDLMVRERCAGGTIRSIKVQIRLYYVELGDRVAIIGLHAHEKDTGRDRRRKQDSEISHAVGVYAQRLADHWGVPELQLDSQSPST